MFVPNLNGCSNWHRHPPERKKCRILGNWKCYSLKQRKSNSNLFIISLASELPPLKFRFVFHPQIIPFYLTRSPVAPSVPSKTDFSMRRLHRWNPLIFSRWVRRIIDPAASWSKGLTLALSLNRFLRYNSWKVEAASFKQQSGFSFHRTFPVNYSAKTFTWCSFRDFSKLPFHVSKIIESETKLRRRKFQMKAFPKTTPTRSQGTEQTTYQVTWLTPSLLLSHDTQHQF